MFCISEYGFEKPTICKTKIACQFKCFCFKNVCFVDGQNYDDNTSMLSLIVFVLILILFIYPSLLVLVYQTYIGAMNDKIKTQVS